jgi:hypothetical protein
MSTRWLSGAVAAFAVLGLAGPTVASADPADVASTHAYLQANYTVVAYFDAHIPAVRAEIATVLTEVRRECPMVATGSPENVDSEQLSDEVIGTIVTTVVQHHLPPTLRAIQTAEPLRWSNGALTRKIRAYSAKAKELTTLAIPNLCGDVKSWVASGFHTLPANTVSFDKRFLSSWVAPGFLPAALSPYETSQDRALAPSHRHSGRKVGAVRSG